MDVELSKSERELLKALYRLSKEGDGAHTSDAADKLGVTPGTVTSGVKRLADRGFVVHRPYKGIELTVTGRVLAVSVIRRHRIVERFLSDTLGYEWQDADRIAVQFEHHIPQELEDKMFATLRNPQSCPHGFLIPAPESSDVPQSKTLNELEIGEAGIIAIPGDLDPEIVQFLDTLGVRPGVGVELREKQPFDGPVVVHVNGENQTLGERLAERIHVFTEVNVVEVKANKSKAREAAEVIN